ncbi:MAG: phytoene/squalene synthase family protein [Bryobacteraceae bacterium]
MTLAESYAWCRNVARSRAKNFYWSFVLLDHARRDSLCAIYAFMRHCDDLSDEPGAKRESLDAWRALLTRALAGDPPADPLWPAFLDTVHRYRIPERYFHEMIDGVTSDLVSPRRRTFDDLYRYCYCVASVAGLSLIHVFGFRSPEALPLAEKCGIAFQLTNIIRDVREDWGLGRVYLPEEDLRRFHVTDAHLGASVASTELRSLLRFEATRAAGYYRDARPLLEMVEPSCRRSLWAIIEIYSRLLDRIEERDFEVMAERVRLATPEKLAILARGWIGLGS